MTTIYLDACCLDRPFDDLTQDRVRLEFDALHIACAESSKADVLLTTDDHMVRRVERLSSQLTVRVANPLAWLREVNR